MVKKEVLSEEKRLFRLFILFHQKMFSLHFLKDIEKGVLF
jgi:hypothetical protein